MENNATTNPILENIAYLQNSRSFLGREFLTWLWFISEDEDHKISFPDLGDFYFYLDDKLVLSSSSGNVHESSLKGGTPAYATESRSALLSGKMVQEAKFILQQSEEEWSWTMKADDLTFRGVRLPTVSEPDTSSHFGKRITYMQTLIEVVEALYKRYIGLRITTNFNYELEKIALWLARKQVSEN